jgi:hypothetical protein
MAYSKMMTTAVAAAVLATASSPAMAAPQIGADYSIASNSAPNLMDNSAEYRRWGRHRHHRVSGDDILTGIGILAGIAILADVVSKDEQRNRRERHDDRRSNPRPDPRNYPPIASADLPPVGDDIGVAVEACSKAAQDSAGTDSRVEAIESVTRNGESWRVEGLLAGKAATRFNCQVTNGRVDSVKLGSAVI